MSSTGSVALLLPSPHLDSYTGLPHPASCLIPMSAPAPKQVQRRACSAVLLGARGLLTLLQPVGYLD